MPTAHLDDRAVIRIAGPDAASLLQNVVTLDIPGVDRHGSGYGALLTPQGKILWDFVLHKAPEDGYMADIRADQAEHFAKRLALYKLRAKVEIAAAPDLAVFAAWEPRGHPQGSPPAHPWRHEGKARPADPRLDKLGARWVAPAGSLAPSASATDWHRHRISLAIPEGGIDFPFGDAFPYDAAMDSLGGIAFEKGCYIGQEVVSRMRHRGTARRRIVALRADRPLPEPGADILAGEHPVGRLGSSADGFAVGLARLDRLKSALDAGIPIRVGETEVSVALPDWATYGWPATASAGEG